MTPRATRERIMRLLSHGPVYIGAIPIMIGAGTTAVETAVRQLTREGKVTRDREGTVRLV